MAGWIAVQVMRSGQPGSNTGSGGNGNGCAFTLMIEQLQALH